VAGPNLLFVIPIFVFKTGQTFRFDLNQRLHASQVMRFDLDQLIQSFGPEGELGEYLMIVCVQLLEFFQTQNPFAPRAG
jgi:hypothetical protein